MIIRAKKYLCLFLLLAIACFASAQEAFAFSHLAPDNNLYAHTLMRDSKGFLWIGSDGLFRYDGVSVKRFIHNPKNSNLLIGNIVKSIVDDRKGKIWIGTIKGISCYDPSNNIYQLRSPNG